MTKLSFNQMVDNLIDFAIKHDNELLSGIQWLDEQARKDGVSFYDKVYELLLKKDAKDKAKAWLESKSHNSKNVEGKNEN